MTDFVIEGVDVEDASRTVLHECDSSGDARRWLVNYTRRTDEDGRCGGWKLIEVYDTRDEEEAVRLWVWEGNLIQAV